MRILLIRFALREQNKFTIPWHLVFFKQILEERGHQVDLLDAQVENVSLQEMVDYVSRNDVDLVGVGGIGTCYGHLKPLCAMLKKKNPKLWIVAGGHVTADRKFILDSVDVDILVNGEGELAFANLVQALSQGDDWTAVRGISYREGQEVRVNPDERLLDMDELPDYDLSAIDLEKYDTHVPDYFLVDDEAIKLKEQGYRALQLFPARGCPFRCTFCYRHIPKYRYYGKDKLEKSIKYFKDHGFAFFVFSDECIVANKKHFADVCEIAKKYNIYWLSNSRVDLLTEEVVEMAMSHNCVALKYGVESFDQGMLDQMKKGTTVEQNIQALNLSYRFGIVAPLQIILGAPGENRRSILNTRRGIWNYWPSEDVINVAVLNPYPGSSDYYHALEQGYVTDKEKLHLNMTNMNKSEISVNFSRLTDAELKAWQWWLHLEAALSFRVKHKRLKLNRSLRYRVRTFLRNYLRLIYEPVNFVFFNFYVFRGLSFWFRSIPFIQWAEKKSNMKKIEKSPAC